MKYMCMLPLKEIYSYQVYSIDRPENSNTNNTSLKHYSKILFSAICKKKMALSN